MSTRCGWPCERMREISAQEARRVFLLEQGLLNDPDRAASPAAVLRVIRQLGFVQLDSIPVVARAHDLTLRARLEDYRPSMLKHLLERRRSLFEHWTHDASVIPVEWYAHWRHRSHRFLDAPWVKRWLDARMGGTRAERERVFAETITRIASEGPLCSRDFKAPDGAGGGGWWEWKPHKAALEFLWWSRELSVTARRRFEKVYDLSERVYPDEHAWDHPPIEETIDFACSEAIARLGCATAAEIASYFEIARLPEVRRWCARAVTDGRLEAVSIGGRPAFAVPNFATRLRRAERLIGDRDSRMRLLAPFDPIVRDRARALRLFDFDYRFEAYVPAAKRRYGYYVLPILQGERIVGRCDLKTDREQGEVKVLGLWWEDGQSSGRRRSDLFEEARAKLEQFVTAPSE